MLVNDKGFIRENCITHFDSRCVELGDVVVPVYNWYHFFQQDIIDAYAMRVYQVAVIDTSRPDSYGLVRCGRNRNSEPILWVRDIYRFGSRDELLVEGARSFIEKIYKQQKVLRGACE